MAKRKVEITDKATKWYDTSVWEPEENGFYAVKTKLIGGNIVVMYFSNTKQHWAEQGAGEDKAKCQPVKFFDQNLKPY